MRPPNREEIITVGYLDEKYLSAIAERLGLALNVEDVEVVLTAKIEEDHNSKHRSAVPYKTIFEEILRNPAEIHRNRKDTDILIFYKRVSPEKYIRLTVLLNVNQPEGYKHSVISYYLCTESRIERERRRGLDVWREEVESYEAD